MPHHLLSILQDLYYTDEYTLLDGDKLVCSQSVKQGCPLSPLLFSIYLNDVDSLAEGVQGLVFQILLFQNCCLLTTSLCCPMFMTSRRPCSTGSGFLPTGNL